MKPPQAPFKVFIGFDPSQMRAVRVAEQSIHDRAMRRHDVRRLSLSVMTVGGLYTRPTTYLSPGYWDVISEAPMSTGHAIARFLVPTLCYHEGWALFCDGDVLFRADVAELFALADPRYAVQVVQHHYEPPEHLKMTGQEQTRYARKNWSSVVLWNCGHPANRTLDVGMVNTLPGRDLHRFCWLDDSLIGALDVKWNWLVGHSPADVDPAIVHFTEGLPDMPGYEHGPFTDEWYAVAKACRYKLQRPPKPEVAA